jgi:hypothetical protein
MPVRLLGSNPSARWTAGSKEVATCTQHMADRPSPRRVPELERVVLRAALERAISETAALRNLSNATTLPEHNPRSVASGGAETSMSEGNAFVIDVEPLLP